MTKTITRFRSLTGAWLTVAALAGCGAGGDLPTVSNMVASGAAYGRTMTVSVSGSRLDSADIETVVEGPCGPPVTRLSGATDAQMQFSCTVSGLGEVVARVRSTAENVELGKLTVHIPVPQVSMTVAQGTRSGSVLIELDPVLAPVSVTNFLAYVNAAYYRNTIFHRVVEGFVAQGGGYTAGPTAKPPTRAPIVLESANGLKNLQYTIAMARTGAPDSATSQFYFNLVDNPTLDAGSEQNPDGYAVFGRVITGQDVIDEIGKVPTRIDPASGLTNLPVTDVVVTSMTQTR